jgi:hypothetical protein
MGKQKREALKVFLQYVEASEKDEPNVPRACYAIAAIFFGLGDEQKANEYLKMGREMEKHTLKLPCCEEIDRSYQKSMASIQIRLAGRATEARDLVKPTSVVRQDRSCDVKCGACGKAAKKLSVCSGCEKTQYCGLACQKKHWPVHKRACGQKYASGHGELKCGACSKTGMELSACGGCEKTQYCGVACQRKHWPVHQKACGKKYANDDAALKCGACSKPETELSVCGGCEKMRYCGLECQKKHWPIHKKACGNTK